MGNGQMTALVQAAAAAAFNTRQASDFSIVAIFSLVGLTLSLVAAHFGLGVT
jgi:hypothetical protein